MNLYQLTASSCAGSYYGSHMHYFASFSCLPVTSLFSSMQLAVSFIFAPTYYYAIYY